MQRLQARIATIMCRLQTWLPNLTSLTQLTLALTFPARWEHLLPTSLMELEISNIVQVERHCPARVLLDLTNLTCLKLNCVRGVDDVYLRHLQPLPALQRCSLMLTEVTGKAFKHFCWEHLTFLSIGSWLDGCHIQYIGTSFPNLQELRISHSHNVRLRSSLACMGLCCLWNADSRSTVSALHSIKYFTSRNGHVTVPVLQQHPQFRTCANGVIRGRGKGASV